MIEAILNTIAPHSCLVCKRQGYALCPACYLDVITEVPPRCVKCLALTKDYEVCSKCRSRIPLKNVWVVSEYQGHIKLAIKRFKFERKRALARPLANLLCDSLPYFKFRPIIVPIPTASSRLRLRGYDHAGLLAKELSRLTGLKHIDLLRRLGQTRQVGAKRVKRLEQLDGAFRTIRQGYVEGEHILLVDDVVTTGSTLIVAAKELKKAGAKSVSAVVLAHRS